MKRKLLFLFFLICAFSGFAQEEEPNRLEIEIKEDEASYGVIPIGSNGFIVVHSYTKGKIKEIHFELYNPSFESMKKGKITVDKSYSFLTATSDSLNIYALFGGSMEMEKAMVTKIAKEDLKISTYNIAFEKTCFLSEFHVLNEVLYFGGSYGMSTKKQMTWVCVSPLMCYIPLLFLNYNKTPVIATLDTKKKTGTFKASPMPYIKKIDAELKGLAVNHESETVYGLVEVSGKKQESRIVAREVTGLKYGKEIPLKMPGNKEINTSKIMVIGKGDVLGMGLYKNKEKAKKRKKNNSAPAGLYFTRLIDGKQVFSEAVPFNAFKKFKFQYSSSNKTKRQKRTADYLQSVTGLVFHPPLVKDDEILMFIEPYEPKYHTETYYTTGPNGQRQSHTVTVFDGYKFYGAVVVAFDINGKFKWENGFKIDGPLSFSLAPKFKFYELDDESIKVIYGESGTIHSRVVGEQDLEEPIDILKVNAKNLGSAKVKTKENGKDKSTVRLMGTEYWYDNKYIIYGTHDGKSSQKGSSKKNKVSVFFVNELEIED